MTRASSPAVEREPNSTPSWPRPACCRFASGVELAVDGPGDAVLFQLQSSSVARTLTAPSHRHQDRADCDGCANSGFGTLAPRWLAPHRGHPTSTAATPRQALLLSASLGGTTRRRPSGAAARAEALPPILVAGLSVQPARRYRRSRCGAGHRRAARCAPGRRVLSLCAARREARLRPGLCVPGTSRVAALGSSWSYLRVTCSRVRTLERCATGSVMWITIAGNRMSSSYHAPMSVSLEEPCTSLAEVAVWSSCPTTLSSWRDLVVARRDARRRAP